MITWYFKRAGLHFWQFGQRRFKRAGDAWHHEGFYGPPFVPTWHLHPFFTE